jgi:hypothetical protein
MKLAPVFAIVAFTFLASLAAHADTYSYPSESDAWFTFDIPGEWHPKVEDGTLEATAPHDAAYVAFWVLKDKTDFENLDKDVGDILKDSVTDTKITLPLAEKEVNGVKFMREQGTGKDVKEKTDVTFEVWMFAPQPGKVGVLYVDYDSDATPEVIKGLSGIIATLKLKK